MSDIKFGYLDIQNGVLSIMLLLGNFKILFKNMFLIKNVELQQNVSYNVFSTIVAIRRFKRCITLLWRMLSYRRKSTLNTINNNFCEPVKQAEFAQELIKVRTDESQ